MHSIKYESYARLPPIPPIGWCYLNDLEVICILDHSVSVIWFQRHIQSISH